MNKTLEFLTRSNVLAKLGEADVEILIKAREEEVRSDEERSNELTTQSQVTKSAHARTCVQDAPPPQPSQ